jgi:hypothetical protein
MVGLQFAILFIAACARKTWGGLKSKCNTVVGEAGVRPRSPFPLWLYFLSAASLLKADSMAVPAAG